MYDLSVESLRGLIFSVILISFVSILLAVSGVVRDDSLRRARGGLYCQWIDSVPYTGRVWCILSG
jgi:hypothetical protein